MRSQAAAGSARGAVALPRRIRLGYGIGDLGASLTFVAINTWLLYYLVNIADVPPVLAGLVFLLGRTFDAVLDPLMGVISDRLRWTVGRMPFIRWGAPWLGLLFALLWVVPGLRPHHAFASALALSLLFSLAYTVVQVPYMALTPELAPDYDERTALSSYRIAFGTVASMLAVAVPPSIVLAFSHGTVLARSAPQGWMAMGVLFAVLSVAAYAGVGAAVPEPSHPPQPHPPAPGLEDVRQAFRITGYGQLFALFVAITIGIMIVNSMLPFYLESALRIPGPQQTPVLGLLFASAIAAFPLWNVLSGRIGKRGALSAGLALLGLALLPLTLVVPPGRVGVALLALSAVAGIGLSAVMLMPWAMLPDVVEFDELASGRRREGVVVALFTFGQKLAGSVGVFANAIATAVFGYIAGAAVQGPGTVLGLRLMTGPVAASVFLASIVLVQRFPITRSSHRAAREVLAARNDVA